MAAGSNSSGNDHIDVSWDYAVCAWARHFNTSEQTIKEAVAAVGNRADRVREHIEAKKQQHSERPSSH